MVQNDNSVQSFSDRSFQKSVRVVDVRAFGSSMTAPKCLFFFQDFERPDQVLGWDIRAIDPRMSAGYPSKNFLLWADFSFLNGSLLSGTGDSQRDLRESTRLGSFAIETPIFITRQADSPESLEFLIQSESPDLRESRH